MLKMRQAILLILQTSMIDVFLKLLCTCTCIYILIAPQFSWVERLEEQNTWKNVPSKKCTIMILDSYHRNDI